MSSLWFMLRKGISQDVSIRFIECTMPARLFLTFLKFFKVIGNCVKIEYSMGDMRSVNGEALQYECYRVSLDTTIAVVEELKGMSAYNGLVSILPPDKVDMYFEKRIYAEIFPLIRLLCIVKWHIRTKNEHYKHIIIWSHTGFFGAIQRALSGNNILLVDYRPLFGFAEVRFFIKKVYNWGQDVFAHIRPKGLRPFPGTKTNIAVHYAEGVDLQRRSDIFWYTGSRISPDRVIIYFDRSYNHRITKQHIRQINSMGMHWLALSWRRDIPCALKHVWRPPLKRGALITAFEENMASYQKNISETEKWLFNAGIELVKGVEYWQFFYKAFNIRIHIDAVEGSLQNVVQNIALDIIGGIHIGKQRSEWLTPVTDMIGYYPDHVFFSWNGQSPLYLSGCRNRNDYCVIAGFPYDAVFAKNKKEDCCIQHYNDRHGIRFVVALYDNMFGEQIHYSRKMMLSFYRKFLEWMLEDEGVILIIKSKKPVILNKLQEIHGLLNRAKATKRCIIMDNVFGRLASDAAYGADIVVGIGISSAVTEAVIAGYRGVHCDLTALHSHPYYEWGYGKVIFDDIDELMKALRQFKENRQGEPNLGDFTHLLYQLDPFRDGKAGRRVGTYMRWFLEAVDVGNGRDAAMQITNEKYVERWGKDKVIEMRSLKALNI